MNYAVNISHNRCTENFQSQSATFRSTKENEGIKEGDKLQYSYHTKLGKELGSILPIQQLDSLYQSAFLFSLPSSLSCLKHQFHMSMHGKPSNFQMTPSCSFPLLSLSSKLFLSQCWHHLQFCSAVII